MAALGDYGLFPELVICVREEWRRASDHRAAALQFLRAYAEGMALTRTDAAVTALALRNYLKLDDDALLQATHDYYSKYFPATLHVPERSIANMLPSLDRPGARIADPKQFFDNSLVDEIGRHAAPR